MTNDWMLMYLYQQIKKQFVKKEEGLGLSEENYTKEEKARLAALAPEEILKAVYPVGSYYWSALPDSPEGLFGFGVWERIKDRFILAAGDGCEAGEEGGEAAHSLTEDELPAHGGHMDGNSGNWGGSFAGGYMDKSKFLLYGTEGRGWNLQAGNEVAPAGKNKGGGLAHNNMPPYITAYCWKRTE